MRIIGGKDYYDGALAYGRDEALVFVRKRHTVAEPIAAKSAPLAMPHKLALKSANSRWDWQHTVEIIGGRSRYFVSTAYIWFAGKRFGVVHAHDPSFLSAKTRWFWSYDALQEFLGEMRTSVSEPHRWRNKVIDASSIKGHFTDQGSAAEREWLITNGVAIAIPDFRGRQEDGWFINTDGLKDIEFAKAVDPFAAFQELSMYVGGVMARPERPTVEVTDSRIVASKHGFDEWSFRKMSADR
jgi:hypothetical protein